MLPILFAALKNSQKEALFIALLSVVSFDLLFITPRFSFHVSDMKYLLSFAIMIIIGQMVSSLAKKAQITQELEMSKKIQDALLESLSHELRTPLAVIKGSSSGLLDHHLVIDPAERIRLIETIDENAEEMEQLISNLINSAKLKNGALTLKMEFCDIEELIGSALLKTEHDQTAKLTLPDNLPTIKGNPHFIEQAIINLLDNAFKYGVEVSLKATLHLDGVALLICNKSTILLPDEISHATSPFVRLSNASSKRGLGLGLHVVQLITDIHHGKLSLKSQNHTFCAELFLPKGL